MKKQIKILLIIIGIVAVTIPSAYFGLQFLAQSEIGEAEVDIIGIELLGLSDDQMIADVEFNVTTTSPVSVSFKVQDINIKYDDEILGNVSLSKDEFTTSDLIYQTTATITITNNALYNQLIEDFINETSLPLTILGIVGFTGALSGLLPQNFSKEISINGLNKITPILQSVEFVNATEDALEFEILANLNNPSSLTANLSQIWIDIYYNTSIYVGNASVTNYEFVSGSNAINFDATFGGNSVIISEIISNYINGNSSSLTLLANITINFDEGSSNYNVEHELSYEFEGTTTELITVDDVDISIDIVFGGNALNIASAAIDITVNITLHNPMLFGVNVTFFDGELRFDDNDVSEIVNGIWLIGGPYSAANNIYIDNATITETIELPGSGSNNGESDIAISSVELGIRLYDECILDDELYIDVVDGIMDLQIGGFEIRVINIDLNDIYVPPSSFSFTLPY